MTTITDKTLVPYENPEWVSAAPSRWVAHYDGEDAGVIDRTPNDTYLVTNRHGRKVGTFRTLEQARQRLSESNSATRRDKLDQSRTLLIGGLVLFALTAAVAAVGVVLLLGL